MSLCSAGLMTIPMDVSAFGIMTAKYRLINDGEACGGFFASQVPDLGSLKQKPANSFNQICRIHVFFWP